VKSTRSDDAGSFGLGQGCKVDRFRDLAKKPFDVGGGATDGSLP